MAEDSKSQGVGCRGEEDNLCGWEIGYTKQINEVSKCTEDKKSQVFPYLRIFYKTGKRLAGLKMELSI